ncbi:hypothetical protein DH2020_033367 [Rehmannia glutinosa]|uniref:Uncharacterized protein n=1 Tax=Rehmannia glutinosa TaxID=99300 RepID=A0ABR0VCH7_REHGL
MELLYRITKAHCIVMLFLAIFAISGLHTPKVQAFKAPFRPRDILPLLPRQVSWPILNALNNAADLMPSFVGAATATNSSPLNWKGACFYNNTAWFEFHNNSGSEFGGGTLHIKVSNAHSWTCMDLYLFATPFRVTWDYYTLSREHTIEFKEWESEAEFEYVSRWGGFETLEKWVTGAYAGHSAVCLRDSEGKLWVAESGHENEQGEDVIAILPWEEWWEFELTKDDSNPHIALLPLHPELRAKFNESAAWEYAKSICKLTGSDIVRIIAILDYATDIVASVMTIWTQMQPAYAGNMWNEALNKRLGTQNFTLSEVLVEVEKRGSSFGELLAIPEQDDWVYADGKSTSCVAFVFELYKEAGLFGKLASSIQIKDAYSLKFFENNSSRLPSWCNDADTVKLPFCQIRGKYRMELPEYNTMDPYPHMNERCPSLPPKYYRSAGC